jgi:hypothetical protein
LPASGKPRRRPSGGVHLAVLSSDLWSATGPRCVSLSGLTMALMLVILTAGDIERPHADQPLLFVENERSRAAVDLDEAQRHARKAGGPTDPVDQRARDTRARDTDAPAQRPRERRDLAAAVASQLHIVSADHCKVGPGPLVLVGSRAPLRAIERPRAPPWPRRGSTVRVRQRVFRQSPGNEHVMLPAMARFRVCAGTRRVLRGYETGTFWDGRALAGHA